MIYKVLLILLFFTVSWIGSAMSHKDIMTNPVDKNINIIKGNFDKIESEPVLKECGATLLPLKKPAEISQVLPITVNNFSTYEYVNGEYPFRFKELVGILVQGNNLTGRSVSLVSHLTGDNWRWRHFGGKEVTDGLFFDLTSIVHRYIDPIGNSLSGDMGFDMDNSFPSMYHNITDVKGEPIKVTFFLKKRNTLIMSEPLKSQIDLITA